ncbi:MAG: hypothetical protein LBJ32_02470 [Oscillospiraceae bacterium]|jgi:uncharacterized coiled-coil DUF342 family protein|nr:hypothetical protein [Oscillospiraceae bacterium]
MLKNCQEEIIEKIESADKFRKQIESATKNIEKIKRITESNSEFLPNLKKYLEDIESVVLLKNFDINRIDILKDNILKILLILKEIFNRFKEEINYRKYYYGLELLLEKFSNYSYYRANNIIFILEVIIKSLISKFEKTENLENFFSLLNCIDFNLFYSIFYKVNAKLNEAEEEALIKDFDEIIEKSRKAEENKTEEAKKAEKEERIKKIEETNKCTEEANEVIDAEIEKINKEIEEAKKRIKESNKKVDETIKENGEEKTSEEIEKFKTTSKELKKIRQALDIIKEIFSKRDEIILNFNYFKERIFDFIKNRENFNFNKIEIKKILLNYYYVLIYISENFYILEAVNNEFLEESNHEEPFRRFYIICEQMFKAIADNMYYFYLSCDACLHLPGGINFIVNYKYNDESFQEIFTLLLDAIIDLINTVEDSKNLTSFFNSVDKEFLKKRLLLALAKINNTMPSHE